MASAGIRIYPAYLDSSYHFVDIYGACEIEYKSALPDLSKLGDMINFFVHSPSAL